MTIKFVETQVEPIDLNSTEYGGIVVAPSGAVIGETSASAIFGANVDIQTITIDGVASANNYGINLTGTSSGAGTTAVSIGAGGTVAGSTAGINLDHGTVMNSGVITGGAGVVSGGLIVNAVGGTISGDTTAISAHSVVNSGSIAGPIEADDVTNGGTISGQIDASAILNSGSVSGQINASELLRNTGKIASSSDAVSIYQIGGTCEVSNHGSISSLASAVDYTADNQWHALSSFYLENSGTLMSYGPPIVLNEAWGDLVTIVNSGTIDGRQINQTAIDGTNTVGTTIFNTGLIAGNVQLGSGKGVGATVHNSGLITGDVRLGSGGAVGATDVVNTGHIVGHVQLGSGDDRFLGLGGSVDGDVHGGDGHDVLRGGASDDKLFGDAGNDILEGGAGADSLDGGTGINAVTYAHALSGGDVNLATGHGLGGDADGDVLTNIQNVFGSSFADVLTGNAQNNRLVGGAGNDTFVGSSGRDVLLGGAGATPLGLTNPT